MTDERWKMATGYSTPDEANAELLDQSAKNRALEMDNAVLLGALRALVSCLDAEIQHAEDTQRDLDRMGATTDGARQRLTALHRVAHARPNAALLCQPHPGTALLAYMEKDREMIKTLRRWISDHGHRIGLMSCPHDGGYACQPGCIAYEIANTQP